MSLRTRFAPGWLLVTLLSGAVLAGPQPPALHAQSDLDAFMRQVLARRDDNWKKLQQYILDEREEINVRGPGGLPLWGDRRDFTWFLQDGFFVRSPLKANGVTVGEDDRRKYEANYLRRTQRRDERQQQRDAAQAPPIPDDDALAPAPPPGADEPLKDVDALIRQTREPQFISSAYFLRFRFDEGRYALVGREKLDGVEVLRVEYYPAKLFNDPSRNGRESGPFEVEMQRLMNKASLVTLWVDPAAHQIVKYTFDNLGLEFLPAPWLVRVEDVNASMTMGQPFPGVWLPRGLEVRVGLALAIGPIDFRYALDYDDYRLADVKSRLLVPEP